MKSYYELIKNGTIDFNKVLLENYNKININETECLVLYHLKQLRTNTLDVDIIASKMTLSDNDLSEVILNLVNKGFIEMKLNDGIEEYSLDNTYKILGYMFENNENGEVSTALTIEMKKTISTIETKFKKILTPNEITVIKKWFYDYKYDINLINETIDAVSKRKVATVNTVDRILFSKTRVSDVDEETIKALVAFKNKYGK